MSWKASSWARGLRRFVSKHDKVVLMVLAERANNDSNECWPSIRMLAEECLVSEKTIKTRLKNLIDQGYVTRLQRGQREFTSRYRLNVDGPPVVPSMPTTPELPLNDPEMSPSPDNNPQFQGESSDLQGESSDLQGESFDLQGESFVLYNQSLEPSNKTSSRTRTAAGATSKLSDFVSRLTYAYRENIGPTPARLLAQFQVFDELHHPPDSWAEEAVDEAVKHSVLNWAYIAAVLTRRCSEASGETGPPKCQSSQPGIEVMPGEFWVGDYLAYTDPKSPYYQGPTELE